MSDNKRTISVDFDGVLHSYINPFNEYQLDPPTDGAIQWLVEMTDKFNVEICSTRAKTDRGRQAIIRWLLRNGVFPEVLHKIHITCEKSMAIIYIDDRGWRFEGRFPTEQEIFAAAKTWNRP
jgi:hypothetical protein